MLQHELAASNSPRSACAFAISPSNCPATEARKRPIGNTSPSSSSSRWQGAIKVPRAATSILSPCHPWVILSPRLQNCFTVLFFSCLAPLTSPMEEFNSSSPFPEGVISFLDTDLYKLTMQCAVFKFFKDIPVTYAFTNRTPDKKLSRAAFKWLEEQIRSE